MHPEITQILERMKYWKKTVEGIKEFRGTSPPSIFVGRSFYPRVFVGVLAPPQHLDNAWLFDSPEYWYKQNAAIAEILGHRSQLIYSRFRSDVREARNKLVETLQKLAAAKKQIDENNKRAKKIKNSAYIIT